VGQYLWQRVHLFFSKARQFKMKVCARAEY